MSIGITKTTFTPSPTPRTGSPVDPHQPPEPGRHRAGLDGLVHATRWATPRDGVPSGRHRESVVAAAKRAHVQVASAS